MGILSLLFGACTHHGNIESVDAETFAKAIRAEHVQLLDVRTEGEDNAGRIEYAVNADVMQPDFLDRVLPLFVKIKKVYVYCRSGKRSMNAARQLTAKGFKVVNLAGGIMEWQSKNP